MSAGFEVRDPATEEGDGTGEEERRLVAMKVGSATVYVEAAPGEPTLEARPGFRPVGLDPTEAFERASDAMRECVSVVGARLESLGDAVKPHELGVEFTITFDVEGKANIIPVLLTGKAKTALGVKVTAKWQPAGRQP